MKLRLLLLHADFPPFRRFLHLAVIRTRSRAKNSEFMMFRIVVRELKSNSLLCPFDLFFLLAPHKYTQIPLPAKILKLLVKDFETAQRGPPSGAGLGLGDGARTPDTDDEVSSVSRS